MATTRKQDLPDTVLFRGKFYGPGKKVEVPEDFPKATDLKNRAAEAKERRGATALRTASGKEKIAAEGEDEETPETEE